VREVRIALAAFFAVLGALCASQSLCAQSFRLLVLDGSAAKWHATRADGAIVLRYAILTNSIVTPGAVNCGAMNPPGELLRRSQITPDAFQSAVTQAFARWQQAVNIIFVEVADQKLADITIGAQSAPVGHAFANVILAPRQDDGLQRIGSAQICLNPQRPWKIGFDGNLATYDLVHSIAHEIGHAIGLDHPVERGHIMSFRYHETRAGLSDGDIRGAAHVYGRREGPTSSTQVQAGQRSSSVE
jgi:predicted Zn-dependent protease